MRFVFSALSFALLAFILIVAFSLAIAIHSAKADEPGCKSQWSVTGTAVLANPQFSSRNLPPDQRKIVADKYKSATGATVAITEVVILKHAVEKQLVLVLLAGDCVVDVFLVPDEQALEIITGSPS